MSVKIEFKKCIICHKSFRWDTYTRCICDECKEQSKPRKNYKVNDREPFITINHKKELKVS